MPRGSSSKGKEAEAINWDWTSARNFDLSAHFGNIDDLRGGFDHKDFRLSRAWICFAQENPIGDVRTNHVSLKFDFKRCDNHPWRGVKLEAKLLDLQGETFKDPSSNEDLTAAAVVLGLKEWAGPPAPGSMRLCVEIQRNFDSVHGGTTLGDLIRILSGSGLLRFGFRTKTSFHGDEAYVGCRDYIAQVLFALERSNRIEKEPLKGADRTVATLDQNGNCTLYKPPPTLFPDIYAVLAIYCEDLRAPDGNFYTVVSSSAVEPGCFRDWPPNIRRTTTGNGYPYYVEYPIGTRSDRVVRPSETYDQEGSTGHGGGYGGQGGGFGGYGSSSGASMPGPSGYVYY